MEPLKYHLLTITTYNGEFEFCSRMTKASTGEAEYNTFQKYGV